MGCKIKKQSGVLYIYLSGELDQYAAAMIKSKIDVEIEESTEKKVIFDLSGVSMMDSSGIGLIIGRYKLATTLGIKIAVCGGNESVKKVITLSGIEKIIPYYNKVEEAKEV